MVTPHDILWGIVVPAAIAVVAMMLSHLPWRRDVAGEPWGPALALGGGFAAAYVAIAGRPKFPPVEAQGWLVYLAVVPVLVGVALTFVRGRWRLLVEAVSIALIIATLQLLLRPIERSIGTSEFRATLRLLVIAVGIWFALMDLLAERRRGPMLPLLLMIWAGGAALVLVDSYSLSLGQLAGASAVVLGVMGLLGFWFRRLSLARGGVLAMAVVLVPVIIAGRHYAELTTPHLMLLLTAPLALWAGEIPPLRRRASVRWGVAATAMLAVLAIPLLRALKGLQQTLEQQAGAYSY